VLRFVLGILIDNSSKDQDKTASNNTVMWWAVRHTYSQSETHVRWQLQWISVESKFTAV